MSVSTIHYDHVVKYFIIKYVNPGKQLLSPLALSLFSNYCCIQANN